MVILCGARPSYFIVAPIMTARIALIVLQGFMWHPTLLTHLLLTLGILSIKFLFRALCLLFQFRFINLSLLTFLWDRLSLYQFLIALRASIIRHVCLCLRMRGTGRGQPDT